MAHHRDDRRLKALLTQECARIMANEGIQDFRIAKRKAALRFAITDRTLLPGNAEIQQALLDYQRLFHADQQANHLRDLRETALEAMRFLADFRPRLVGPVLSGTAGPHSGIHLHLFADTPKDILMFMLERHIPFETLDRRLRMSNGVQVQLAAFRFNAGDHPVDLTVFPLLDERQAPCSPVDGRPMHRAGLTEVETLLLAASPPQPRHPPETGQLPALETGQKLTL